ncbi:hypothetical protein [Bifidobacterium sp. ESL0704]|uniref:hypothetical protein n=1 Tax=Bifidobacterium sp. ESL0704 TaxID=2983219 RepID=UPI0023F85739|nr:hypothetical protein [Bifidobacterium sp. ESL0704]WEV52922.1 hypothetical protein OZX64_08745 [Bifidobacterium sp. ESL0704]
MRSSCPFGRRKQRRTRAQRRTSPPRRSVHTPAATFVAATRQRSLGDGASRAERQFCEPSTSEPSIGDEPSIVSPNTCGNSASSCECIDDEPGNGAGT